MIASCCFARNCDDVRDPPEILMGKSDHAVAKIMGCWAPSYVQKVIAGNVGDGSVHARLGYLRRRVPAHAHEIAVLATVAYSDQRQIRAPRPIERLLDSAVFKQQRAQLRRFDIGWRIKRLALAVESRGETTGYMIGIQVFTGPK